MPIAEGSINLRIVRNLVLSVTCNILQIWGSIFYGPNGTNSHIS